MPEAEVVPLSGCNEVALALEFADAVVDVVETGATARAMGLVEVRTLAHVQHGIWATPRGRDQLLHIPQLRSLIS